MEQLALIALGLLLATALAMVFGKIGALTSVGLAVTSAAIGAALGYVACYFLSPASAYYCALASSFASTITSSVITALLMYSSTHAVGKSIVLSLR